MFVTPLPSVPTLLRFVLLAALVGLGRGALHGDPVAAVGLFLTLLFVPSFRTLLGQVWWRLSGGR